MTRRSRSRPSNAGFRSDADRRAAGRERWRRWARLRARGQALCAVRFDGGLVARLVLAGWLDRRPDDRGYTAEEVAAAIDALLATADLPRKKTLTR
jgi:hypothetical protein